jgi:hypothetical protein
VIGVCVYLVYVFQPPSRANFKGTKKSFCIGAGKDALHAHIHCSPDGYQTLTRRHGSFPAEEGRRGPREQRPTQTDVISLSGPVFGLALPAGRPRGATRWRVGERTPLGRTGLRPCRRVGPRRRFWASGGQGARRSAPPVVWVVACLRRGRDDPGRGNGTTDLSVAGGPPGGGQATGRLT